ncbi:Flp pilus assembly protein CpaB [Dethiobacter alkaliphilus]|uniref:Flp pilus assembly protein CpaB n=1 Tax=Dethiobacter alkaliphilus TaxID=427926 RepID=UPI002227BCF3|nr:Flp pilus assembly protein CpaB [Dethiobacter alkaliphilus]MCW3489630.1 Flp pilus assembly protein CpaB [Dethiobacter alkaliphilus]
MKGKKFFILSLILALVAAGAIFHYLNEMDRQSKSAANLTTILVAREEIPARTRLSASMFTTAEVPQDAIHGDAIRETSELDGAYARERLVAGEQVLSARLVFEQSETGLSYKVSDGHRAVTVPVNNVSGVAGYILPGDYVDAIVTIESTEDEDTVTKVVESKIKVLASGQYTVEQDREQLVVDTVTLDAPADAVTAIIQASERGSLRLVLRPVEESNDRAIRAHRLSQF